MTESPAAPSTPGGAQAVDASLFRLLVDAEMHKAQRLRYCISVICVCARAVATELASPEPFLELFRRQLRATDIVAPWPPASLAVLLVDAETGDIPAVMRRITGHLTDGSWRAGGVSYPTATLRADDMLREAANLMDQALRDPAKQLYLA